MSPTSRRVFLVEESATMRELLSSWLQRDGYEVVSGSAADLRRYFQDCFLCDIPRPRIDAVVCEAQQSATSGMTLLDYLRSLSSDVRTLVICDRCGDALRYVGWKSGTWEWECPNGHDAWLAATEGRPHAVYEP